MKTLLKIWIVLSILGAFAACEKNDALSEEQTRDLPPPPLPPEYYCYALQNKSGHTITIVQKPACSQMTDSLILPDGVVFGFDLREKNPGLLFFNDFTPFTSRVIYYDSRYVLEFSKYDFADKEAFGRRLFFDPRYYVEVENSDWQLFTFTEADYQYAVEHGMDLGEPKK